MGKLSEPLDETLTPFKRRQLQIRVSRWLKDEQWIGNALRDDRDYSNKTEILRNLGTAIAYAQRQLAAGRAQEFFKLPDGKIISFNPGGRWHGWIFRQGRDGKLPPSATRRANADTKAEVIDAWNEAARTPPEKR